jgi:cytoskeletal protein RodZ
MDDDNLYFSFDDEEEDAAPEVEESQNRSFLIGAIALAAVFVLGICAVVIWAVVIQPRQGTQVSDIELTNAANMTLAAATQTSQFMTDTAPTVPPEPVETQEPSPTATIEAPVVVTEESTAEATEETGAGTEVAEVTPAEGEASPTPLTAAETPTVVTTSGIIEVTPLGGPTPTRVSGSSGGGVTPTGIGGPIGPTPVATLPTTGFSGGSGLAGIGLLALALVAVVVVARRIRLK